MLENLSLLAIVIIIFWVGLMVFYVYISNRQKGLQKEIDALRERLDRGGKDER